MASPPTSYPTVTLSNHNPETGDRQLRRTPVGLRRMYPDSEISSDVSEEPKGIVAGAGLYWCLGFLLLFVLLMLCGGVITWIVLSGNTTTTNPVIISTTEEPSNQTTISSTTNTGTATTPSTTTTARRTTTTPVTPGSTTPQTICEVKDLNLDIYLLIENSGKGIGLDDFNVMKNFLTQTLFSKFHIEVTDDNSTYSCRVALAQFHDVPSGNTNFVSIGSTQELIGQIDTIRPAQEKTSVNLGAALEYTRNISGGNRPKVGDVVLVFIAAKLVSREELLNLQGHSDAHPERAADNLKGQGMNIITVSIGNAPALPKVASCAKDDVRAKSVYALDQLFADLINALCRKNQGDQC